MRSTAGSVSIAAITLVLTGGTALAADADAFGQRLQALLAQQGGSMTYESALSEGDNVVLKGLAFGSGEERMALGDVTFEDVSGSTAEGWRVERIPIADVTETNDRSTVEVSDMEIEGLELIGTQPPADVPDAKRMAQIFFDSARIGSVNVMRGDDDLFTLDGASFTNEITDDGTFNSSLESGDFTVNFPADDPDEVPQTMRTIGYESLTGSLGFESTWEPETGRIAVDPFTLQVANAGDLTQTYAITGYTSEVARSLQQVQEQMAQNPGNSDNSGMAMMGILAQLSIESASISFEDDSLTEKLLDYYGKQYGMTPEQVADAAVQSVQAVAASLQNPDFQNEVTEAVRTFLADPQSIEIAIDPQAPIPAMQVMGAVMGAPQTLPQVLSLSVTANAEGDGETDGETAQ